MTHEAVLKAERDLAIAKAVTAAFPDARLTSDRWVSNLVADHVAAQCGIYGDTYGRLTMHLYVNLGAVTVGCVSTDDVRVWQAGPGGYGGFAEVPAHDVLEALAKGPAAPELRATIARMMKARDETIRKENEAWEARQAAEKARQAEESKAKAEAVLERMPLPMPRKVDPT